MTLPLSCTYENQTIKSKTVFYALFNFRFLPVFAWKKCTPRKGLNEFSPWNTAYGRIIFPRIWKPTTPTHSKMAFSFKPERRVEISCALECKKQARQYLIILRVEVVDQQVDSTGGDHGVGDAGAGVGQTGQQTAGQHQHLVIRRLQLVHQQHDAFRRQRHLVLVHNHPCQHHHLRAQQGLPSEWVVFTWQQGLPSEWVSGFHLTTGATEWVSEWVSGLTWQQGLQSEQGYWVSKWF